LEAEGLPVWGHLKEEQMEEATEEYPLLPGSHMGDICDEDS
jgi:hypothetical protein